MSARWKSDARGRQEHAYLDVDRKVEIIIGIKTHYVYPNHHQRYPLSIVCEYTLEAPWAAPSGAPRHLVLTQARNCVEPTNCTGVGKHAVMIEHPMVGELLTPLTTRGAPPRLLTP